jgi:LCP family protein required for cell wall assembly
VPKNPYEPRAYLSRNFRGVPGQSPVDGPPPRRLGPRWGRLAFVTMVVVSLLVGCGVLGSYLWARGVDENLRREDPFASLDARPEKGAGGATNILMLGTDSRDPENGGESGSQRSDTMAILHLPANAQRAYLISLPRDLWVHVPRGGGGTMAKINAAFAWGGLPLAVATVEQYTGVRMDHVALIDFGGFVKVTDAVGGVDLTVEQTITSIHPPYRTFQAGPQHLTGDEALDYVRQRYQFPDGDFARMRHQQQFLKALVDKAASLGTLTSVGSLKAFISSVADTMTVDKDFSMVDLGWQLRGLRGADITFMISPHKGTSTVGGQSVVLPDKGQASGLYNAMSRDRLDDWVSAHGTGE